MLINIFGVCRPQLVYEPAQILCGRLLGHDKETYPPVFGKSSPEGFNH
jgi:hypothetical protein